MSSKYFQAVATACLSIFLATVPLAAVPVQPDAGARELRHPDLHIPAALERADGPGAAKSAALGRDLVRLGVRPEHALLDLRGGRWATLISARPMIPGTGAGNLLEWKDLGQKVPASSRALERAAWKAFSDYLAEHRDALGIDLDELAEPRITVHDGGDLVQIHVPRSVAGIPVRSSYLTAVLNHGNLVTFGAHQWGDVETAALPTFSKAAAIPSILAHLDEGADGAGWQAESLVYVPLARGGDPARVVPGKGYDYRLAWLARARPGSALEPYEALVDAHSGELLSFEDTRHRATVREVAGGVLPATKNDVEQAGWPMPFADITTGGGSGSAVCNNGVCETGGGENCLNCPADCNGEQGGKPANRFCCGDGGGEGPVGCNDGRCTSGGFSCSTGGGGGGGMSFFADSGGNLLTCTDGDATTTLDGQFVRVADACGAISETGSGVLVDLGTSPGSGCTVAAGASAGNTRCARTSFYELNRIKEMGRGQLPSNAWLNAQLTINTNGAGCFWGGSTMTLAATCCESVGVLDHEWGHGMDDNDANPTISSPSEGIADVYTALRQNNSCIGEGFQTGSNCSGYGDPCTQCDGVRDVDWARRASGQPHDLNWIAANCSAGNSPCGGSPHCEGAVVSEAIWDLVHRDLPGDLDTNLEIVTRLTYLGGGLVGSWYQCVQGSGGCPAGSGYLNFLAADDDNGDLGDGTPHMTAIFAAFDRHGIACATPTVQDGGCAGAPTTAPVVSAVGTAHGASLSWAAVSGASSYAVFRTDGGPGCDFGKVRVGETTATFFDDTGLQAGRDTFYTVIPLGAGDTCMGPASSCVTVVATPAGVPCPGCGDGTCDAPEDACSCAQDCGAPPAGEVPNLTCTDLVDNDCDGAVDCDDSDCAGVDPACSAGSCGDGVCDTASENCLTCPGDCAGTQGGKPANRFCCGDGGGENPVGCGDARCTQGGLQCI